MEKPHGEPTVIRLEDLEREAYRLEFIELHAKSRMVENEVIGVFKSNFSPASLFASTIILLITYSSFSTIILLS